METRFSKMEYNMTRLTYFDKFKMVRNASTNQLVEYILSEAKELQNQPSDPRIFSVKLFKKMFNIEEEIINIKHLIVIYELAYRNVKISIPNETMQRILVLCSEGYRPKYNLCHQYIGINCCYKFDNNLAYDGIKFIPEEIAIAIYHTVFTWQETVAEKLKETFNCSSDCMLLYNGLELYKHNAFNK